MKENQSLDENMLPALRVQRERFAGFARTLHKRVRRAIMQMAIDQRGPDEIVRIQEEIVAKAAYELVKHAVGYCLEYESECGMEISGAMGTRILASIPDLPTWAEE